MDCWGERAKSLLAKKGSSREYQIKLNGNDLDQENEAEAGNKSEVISLVAACERVGHCFDLWQEDAMELVDLVELAWEEKAKRLPLANLFTPSLKKSPDLRERRDVDDDDNDDFVTKISRGKVFTKSGTLTPKKETTFKKGDVVKAKLSQEFKAKDDCGEKYIDDTREWYYAVIQSQKSENTYHIEWEHGYEGDQIKSAEDMIHVFDKTYMNGVRYALAKGRSWTEFGGREVLVSLFFLLTLAVVPEVVITSTIAKSSVCAKETLYLPGTLKPKGYGYLAALCSTVKKWNLPGPVDKHATGVLIGVGCIAAVFCVAFVLMPLIHAAMCYCCPFKARKALRVTTLIADSVRQANCPLIHGKRRGRLAILTCFSVCLICAVLAVVLSAPGIIPLGFVCAGRSLDVINLILGESTGRRNIQKDRICMVLEKLARRCQIDITDDDIRLELTAFLSSPFDSGLVQVSLAFVTLLASVFDETTAKHWEPSVRIDQFLIADAYASFTHPPKTLAKLKSRQDIIVNVFKDRCKVPGIDLTGDRWYEKGSKLPWHLAIVRESIQYMEEQMRSYVKPGDGCFTWRSPRNGRWRTRENNDPSKRIAIATQLLKKHNAFSSNLNDILHDSAQTDDARLTKALLAAGASANFRTEVDDPKTSTFVRAALAGKLDSLKMLLDKGGADISAESEIPSILEQAESTHFSSIKDEVMRMVHGINMKEHGDDRKTTMDRKQVAQEVDRRLLSGKFSREPSLSPRIPSKADGKNKLGTKTTSKKKAQMSEDMEQAQTRHSASSYMSKFSGALLDFKLQEDNSSNEESDHRYNVPDIDEDSSEEETIRQSYRIKENQKQRKLKKEYTTLLEITDSVAMTGGWTDV